MPKTSTYRLPLKRRRLGITNYYKRRKLILSKKPRLVVRVLSRTIIVQLVKVHPKGDITLVSSHSKELLRYGWKGGSKNTPAAYLLGFLAALKAQQKGIKEAVLDIGLHRPVKGARVFAVAKGAIDGGLKIPADNEIFPDESRIKGEHIASYAKDLKEKNPELYKARFSEYLSQGLEPENIPEHFEEIKNSILKTFKEGKSI
ncbi:MAG: 50S ribosomal protein L18 [Infirmifilum sp.]|uniref:Large ribosomal subunit protein uL18 n=1 Tax=Infirmifilum uzonense TaxID=1550241 RepID=A0A0F7FFU8_9CREN|nr:50S ribosomal protein L18 [Infirmifilum uzonense]AKG38049.1 50S ribosomal protein L18 [Infirmifilum uzonense]